MSERSFADDTTMVGTPLRTRKPDPPSGESRRQKWAPVEFYRAVSLPAAEQIEEVVIPPGCRGLVYSHAELVREVSAGTYASTKIRPTGPGPATLYVVRTSAVPMELDVQAVSRDGWTAPLTLQAIVRVDNAALIVEQADPVANLHGLLVSVALRAVNQYTAADLNGMGDPAVHLTRVLSDVRRLYEEEAASQHGVPGLSLMRLDIVRGWTDAGLLEHLKRREALRATLTAAREVPEREQPPPSPTGEPAMPSAGTGTSEMAEASGATTAPRLPAPAPAKTAAQQLVELLERSELRREVLVAVVRELVAEGRLTPQVGAEWATMPEGRSAGRDGHLQRALRELFRDELDEQAEAESSTLRPTGT